ncbi:PAS/PAC sensor signal transduction histidine kinase [Methanohalobium evestigatum Z-7303]|uniref:histidine kinase n=1 Tax=Methanohalobium evestigatum (strain ATCC BAA-1072 / DSM 3721 / NBRC 107634 / OCM 161 / Z-7303) TaxID=644295 RepID=D7E997_METEZ|nr:PAS domain-containing sensor histidine kinase [Methanohalobium evestigatum]ADI74045.1 PAS/PAC sensor signal transduction histidine kinase [Methanohalobium evestigatum Z-7303]
MQNASASFDLVYKTMNEGVCFHEIIYNSDGYPVDYKIIDINPAYESIVGLKRDEVVGQLASNIYDTGEAPFLHTYAKVAETGEQTCFETYFSLFGKHIRITVISPNKSKFITIFTDITSQRKTDDELKTIYENVPMVIMMVDSERRIFKVNKSAELFSGTTSDEMVGLRGGEALRCLNSLSNPDGCGFGQYCQECKVKNTVIDTFETGNNHYNVETSLPFMIDGDVKYLTFLISTSLINNDEKPKVIVSLLDITERKKTQKNLNKEKDFFEKVAETSPVCITKVNKNGNIVYANSAAENVLGLSKSEIEGRTYDNVKWKITDFKGNLFPETELPFELVQKYQKPVYDVRHAIEWPNGQRKLLSINAAPIFDDNGNFGSIIATIEDITAYKEKEDTLHLMKNTLESSINAIAISDLDGYLTYANSASLDMWEYNKEEILGKHITEFWQYKENAINVYHYLHENGSWKSEGKAKTKHGNVFDVYSLINLVNDESGKPVAIAGSFVDITKRKSYEEKLKKSEQQLRNYIDNSPIGIFVIDKNGNYVDVNPAACHIIGYTKDELLSMNIIDLHPDNAHELAGQIFEELLENGKVSAELPFITKNDSLRYWILDAVKLLEDKYIGFTTDITDRKRIEEELRESEERFRTLTEQAADAIIAHDFDGNIVYVNNLACENLGYSKEELLSMNIADISAYINSYDPKTVYWEKLSPSDSYLVETKLRRKDGSYYPAEVKLTRIDLKGRSVILGFVREITIRKQAEESLINSKLEAEAASQAKSELLANVSHELRTPLTSIIGFSDILLKGKLGDLNESQKTYLSKVHRSGKHLLDLITDILDLSKIESGKHELHCEKVSIPQLMKDLKENIYPFASQKGLEINIDINRSIEYIYADKIKLRQILYNLVYNAVKFTEQGSVTVKLDWNDNDMLFSVIDTGIGIPADKQDEIFDSFKQLDSGASRRYSGTGLGLALVERLVEMHGGKIWVESEEREGSRFSFIIPEN